MLLASALLVLTSGAEALAHGETSPTIQTVIDDVEPEAEGIEFRIVRGKAARLAATNESGRALEVLGRDGRPFLRIGPGGVYANVNSLDWYRSGNPDGVASPPAGVDIGGPVRFERVLRRPSFAWFDHRLHPGTVKVPPTALEAQRVARLDDWTVPARLDGEELEVRGHVEYRPLLGGLQTRMSSPAEPLPGVQVQLLQGPVPGFFVVNAARAPLTVLGRDGEPFLRVGPGGVEVNLHSRTHVEDQLAKGEPGGARPEASDAPATAPLWRRVSSANSYAWLDTRAFYERQRPPAEVSEGGERAVLKTFSIPLEAGGHRARIEGSTAWVPFEDPAREPGGGLGALGISAIVTGSLVFGLALFGALLVRRRGRIAAL